MSKTLLELWKESPPGTRFRQETWPAGMYFIPCEETPRKLLLRGILQASDNAHILEMLPGMAGYEIYQEPITHKPKVNRAQYIVQMAGGLPLTTDRWYENDIELRANFDSNWNIIARLNEMEFDE